MQCNQIHIVYHRMYCHVILCLNDTTIIYNCRDTHSTLQRHSRKQQQTDRVIVKQQQNGNEQKNGIGESGERQRRIVGRSPKTTREGIDKRIHRQSGGHALTSRQH